MNRTGSARSPLWRALSLGIALVAASAHGQIDTFVDAGRGPVQVHLPPAVEEGGALPLVINLHGYGGDANSQSQYFGLTPAADARGFILATPDGTQDFFGLRFWNATDACCDFFQSQPDDSSYLRTLIEVIAASFDVDDRRIHVVGHSNGGFMAHRMACDHADRIAAIVSFAGAQWEQEDRCAPSEAVAVAQLHGTGDGVIQYTGGCIPGLACYPSARESVQSWAALNGCDLQAALRRPF
ncbi:MAG: alpha/beta fold hydrolase, partial [Pseudomonadota bacterium]